MNISIIGGGDLARAFSQQTKHTATIYSHCDYDIAVQTVCDQLVLKVMDSDAVIITAGVYGGSVWNVWLVNTVAPSYLISELITKQYSGKIVVISSNAANWTSWPGSPVDRIVYNNSKHAISNFVYGVEHSGFGQFTVLEPSRFQSKMSNYQGTDIDQVVQTLEYALSNSVYSIKLPSPK